MKLLGFTKIVTDKYFLGKLRKTLLIHYLNLLKTKAQQESWATYFKIFKCDEQTDRNHSSILQ